MSSPRKPRAMAHPLRATIDKSRGQHQAVKVDDVAVPGYAARRLDHGDPVPVDDYVGRAGRAPVPSTSRSPRSTVITHLRGISRRRFVVAVVCRSAELTS